MNQIVILPNYTPATSLQIHIVLFIGDPYIVLKCQVICMINKIVVNILPTFKQTHVYILELTEVSICANMRLKHFYCFYSELWQLQYVAHVALRELR